MATKRIRVTVTPNADRYARKDCERIIEYTDPVTGLGGLISFLRRSDGSLQVYLYRHDERVQVSTDRDARGGSMYRLQSDERVGNPFAKCINPPDEGTSDESEEVNR